MAIFDSNPGSSDPSSYVLTKGSRQGLLARWLQRCSSPDCPRGNRFFPAYLRPRTGLFFDGRWYCSADCARTSLGFRVQNLLSAFLPEKPRNFRVPLGLLLVNRGAITYDQLRDALYKQRAAGQGRLGDWLLKSGYISDSQLTAALGQQWACPVFPLEGRPVPALLAGLAPFVLFQSARAVPVHVSADGGVLYVAFCSRIDHTLLYALEQMLGCRTVGCVASEASVLAALESMSPAVDRHEVCFDTVRDPREIASTIRSYADELRADRISLVRAGAFLWTRFRRGSSTRDLLFRILPSANSISDRIHQPSKVAPIPADIRKDGVSNALAHV